MASKIASEIDSHQLTISLDEAFPGEVIAGTKIDVVLRLSCSDGCDLNHAHISIINFNANPSTRNLTQSEPQACIKCELTAAKQAGTSNWKIQFPQQELAGFMHEATEINLTSLILPHRTSIAVWNIPSPSLGSSFKVAVGVKCSAGCDLSGKQVEIKDESGLRHGAGVLGTRPRPGTEALYETELCLNAQTHLGIFPYIAFFAADNMKCEHHAAIGRFSIRTLEPAEHIVTVRFLRENTDIALSNIDVWIGEYKALTNESGVARVHVPRGDFELSTVSSHIESQSVAIVVREDMTVELQAIAKALVDEDSDRRWV